VGLLRAVISSIFLLSINTASYANEFKLVFAEYKPYSWVDDRGEVVGIEIDVLREAIHDRMRVPVSFQVLPWARAQMLVKQGEADAFVAFPSEQRKLYTKVSKEAVTTWGVSIFAPTQGLHIKELSKIREIAELKSYTLGSMIGNGWANKNLAGMDVTWVPKMEQLIKLVALGRVEALPDSPIVVKFYMRELGLEDEIIELSNLMSTTLHLCIGIKSNYLDMLPLFDKTLREMANDGALKKILSKYE